jgi:hypothetical protein
MRKRTQAYWRKRMANEEFLNCILFITKYCEQPRRKICQSFAMVISTRHSLHFYWWFHPRLRVVATFVCRPPGTACCIKECTYRSPISYRISARTSRIGNDPSISLKRNYTTFIVGTSNTSYIPGECIVLVPTKQVAVMLRHAFGTCPVLN